jgi:hypothetical protein
MSREEASFWCGYYGLTWPRRGEVADAEAFLDAADVRLAGVHDQERAGAIMQALYTELEM